MARYSNVVVLIPGILGSVLAGPNGATLWGTSAGTIFRNLATLGRRLDALTLDGDDPDLDDLDDGIRVAGPIADLHLLPGLWKIDGYTRIKDTLVERLGLEPGRNYFEFAYDWRRDNRVAARRLDRAARGWLGDWREKSGNKSARLVLIAHSMGGLVARHFLEVAGGWRDTEALITFGTPYRGAPSALKALSNGHTLAGLIDVSTLVRSLTSVHQLLPTYKAIVATDHSTARIGEVFDIPNLAADRVAAARAFHDEIRDAQASNSADEAYARDFRVVPFIGYRQPTFSFARASDDGVELLRRHAGQNLGGDGRVPRVSALPGEMSDDAKAFFLAEKHASLQNSSAALDHVCARLEGASIDYGRYRDDVLATLSFAVEDAYVADEPIRFTATCSAYRQRLKFSIADAETAVTAAEGWLWNGGNGDLSAEVALAPGVYRIRIAGEGVSSVTDVFTVLQG